jgi:cellulose biosynthesis protein BcsQ
MNLNQKQEGPVITEGPEKRKRPVTIAFTTLKGGAGKSRSTLLLANCLGTAGKRVSIIDTDHNNEATYTYDELAARKSVGL